jgi:uncharacterized protein
MDAVLEFDEPDPAKEASNRQKHGFSLHDAVRMDWRNAVVLVDRRFDYREERFRAWGYLDGRMHMAAFTMRGMKIRMISFRKANRTECRRHGKEEAGPG